MTASTKRMWAGIVIGWAACLTVPGALPAGAIMSHDSHIAQDSTVDVATPVHAQAGPALQDKMSKAIEQI